MTEEYNVIASLEDKINQKTIQVFTEIVNSLSWIPS